MFALMGVLIIVLTVSFYIPYKEKSFYSIICIPKVNDGSNFWNTLAQGAQMAAEDYGVNLEFSAPDSEDNYEQQIQLLHHAISKKPDAILLASTDYEKIADAAKEVKNNGIKLVIIDSGIKGNIGDCTISTDNVEAGIRLGAAVKGVLKENGKIGVVSYVKNAQSAMDRERGLHIGLNDAVDHIVETVYCDSDYDKAYEVTKKMLTSNPDINIIAGLNQYSAVGAVRAVKDMGLLSQIKMFGVDNSIEEIEYLEAGIFEGIVIQKPFNIGYMGVERAVWLLEGKKIESYYDSGSAYITKENMYAGYNQKLLFPFMKNSSE